MRKKRTYQHGNTAWLNSLQNSKRPSKKLKKIQNFMIYNNNKNNKRTDTIYEQEM